MFFIGLSIGVVGAGLGTYFLVENLRSDPFPSQIESEEEPPLIAGIEVTDDSILVKIDLDGLPRLLLPKSSFERAITLQSVTDRDTELELLRLFKNVETVQPASLRDEIQAALVRQIAQERPKNALDQVSSLPEVRRIPLVDIVFQEWSVKDLQRSIESAENMDDEDRTAALEGILRSRIDLTDDVRREIALQLGGEQVILNQWAIASNQEDFDDPSAEWSKFLTNHGKDVQTLSADQIGLLKSIARSWIRLDGFGAMAQVMSTSLDDYRTSVSVIEVLLKQVVIQDPRVVVEAARGMNSEVRSIVLQALTNLAERDPEAAFEIASMMEAGSSQVALQRAAVRGWIEADPKAVLEARATLPDEFQSWAEQSSLMSMVRTMPEEVPPFIPTIKDKTQMEIVVTNLSLNWARKDPMAVFEWLQAEPEAQKWYGNVLSDVLEGLTERNPEEAIRFALEQPPREYDGVGREVSVVWKVAQTDVDAAVSLIDHARDEKTRDSMYESIGIVLINQAQFKRAMDWAENLKEEQREEYWERVVNMWASGNPEQLYEEIDTLPSDKLRETAADWLIGANEYKKAFSAEQIEKLKKYLPEEAFENQ